MGQTAAQKVWRSLGTRQRWALLRRLASRYDKLWSDRCTGERRGIVAVGLGYKTLTSARHVERFRREGVTPAHIRSRSAQLFKAPAGDRVLTRELCLRVLVDTEKPENPPVAARETRDAPPGRAPRRKPRRAKPPRWEVPPEVITTIRVRGRRRRCAVPTDVERAARPVAHAAIVAADPAGRSVTGSACCEVVDADRGPNAPPAPRLLLGCNHVFTVSKARNGVESGSVVLRRNGSRLAGLYDYTRLRPQGGGNGFDAAIAQVDLGLPLPAWLARPSRVHRPSEPLAAVEIWSYRHIIRGAVFSTVVPSQPVLYGNTWVRVGPVYEFHSAATQAGDSGAAVVADGALCGMHIAGDPQTGKAFAHPAPELLRPGRFSVPIDLP